MLITQLALVQFLGGVRCNVLVQIVNVAESLVALSTLVGRLPGVYLSVCLQLIELLIKA